MRSLLNCMMRQSDKIEKFKKFQHVEHALHAKYNSRTLDTVHGDQEWGHLQLDATGLFLLMLAQMTASGLKIIYSRDEVEFVQNLVFYIESAYRTADYGIWERGDKTNHGVAELNASSVGMCLAALEAIDGLDLFQCRGGYNSIIHVLSDEKARCQDILESLLPRESHSKEVGAALLPVILYPAFAVPNLDIVNKTTEAVNSKLSGTYGYVRFLRDGYWTPIEDKNRLHYDPFELEQFDQIECHWPLFLCFQLINKVFQQYAERGNDAQISDEISKLEEQIGKVLIYDASEHRLPMLPMAYAVPAGKHLQEKQQPGSVERVPVGHLPHIWGQALYIVARLLAENLITPGEIDPLNRRLSTQKRPEVVVQVAVLATTDFVKEKLRKFGFTVQTPNELTQISVKPMSHLMELYSLLGRSKKLKLSGRPKNRIGVLGTSKLYEVQNQQLTIFYPEFTNTDDFWIVADIYMLIDRVKTELNYLQSHWTLPGRPTIVIPIGPELLRRRFYRCRNSVQVFGSRLQNYLKYGGILKLGDIEVGCIIFFRK